LEYQVEETSKKAKRPGRRVLLTVLAVLVVMAVVSLFAIYQVEKAEAYSRYMGVRNVSSERVAKIVRGAEMSANNVFDDVSRNLGSSEEVIAALKDKADLNLDVRGYFAAFVPNFFPEKGIWFEPYIYQPETGGFEFRQVGSARHNYMKSTWYLQAMESGGSFWSEPYYYYDGTSMSGHYCTFAKPIFDAKGEIACVCGADMKLEFLTKELEWVDETSKNNKMLNKYQPYTEFDFYSVIFSADGTCIAHPDEKSLSITDKDILDDLAKGRSGVVDMDVDGQACTLYYGPIEFVEWTVAVIVPRQDFLKPMLPAAIVLLSLVIIGVIIVWFVCKRL
jgi:hypothetical protein